MGTVYAGEHVEIGKGVAIKILHPAYSTQQDLVERFRREARAASRIGHPNIVDVTDFGSTEDGCAYFVMEHLDGIDLADVLSHERRLDATRACNIAIQICRALAAAHAAGVIHRDLKPENIFLVARDGQADFVKVLDFGIARSMGRARRLTNPGVAMGTPEYMAPEQAEGGAVDHRSDIYSVGALIYEMASGSPPQLNRDKDLIPPRGVKADIPEELDRIVMRALERDPDRRYQTMGQLEYDLVKSLFGRPRAVVRAAGPARHRVARARRWRWRWWARPTRRSRRSSRCKGRPRSRTRRKRRRPRPRDGPTSGREPGRARRRPGRRLCGRRPENGPARWSSLGVAAARRGADLPPAAVEHGRARRRGRVGRHAGAGGGRAQQRAGTSRAAPAPGRRRGRGDAGRQVRLCRGACVEGAPRELAGRRRRRDRRHAVGAREAAAGAKGRGRAGSRPHRRRRRALPGGADAGRARGRRGGGRRRAADARAVGVDRPEARRGGSLGARGADADARRSVGARAGRGEPGRRARLPGRGGRVRKGAGDAARRSGADPRPAAGPPRDGDAVTPPAAARRRSVERRPPRRRRNQPSRPSPVQPRRRRRPNRRPTPDRGRRPTQPAPRAKPPRNRPTEAKEAPEPAAAKPAEDKAEPEPAKEAPAREAPARAAGKQPDEAAEAAPSAPAEPAADQQQQLHRQRAVAFDLEAPVQQRLHGRQARRCATPRTSRRRAAGSCAGARR